MTRQLLFTLLCVLTLKGYSQTERYNIDAIGISTPIIWNNSEATYYALGSPKYPYGKGMSYGLNINYSRSIYKNVYAKVGVGYFKQAFSIKRPFNFASPLQPLFHTQSYYYNTIQYYGGVGYRMKINTRLLLKGEITYNWFNSFNQKYVVNKDYRTSQINKESIPIGSMINFNIGAEKRITNKISIGIDALLPVLTVWNNDDIFLKYDYSADTQQIARNKFSIGANVSIKYYFLLLSD